jgi:hypothetical protein
MLFDIATARHSHALGPPSVTAPQLRSFDDGQVTEMTRRDSDNNPDNGSPHARRWGKHAITVLLLLALVITGTSAYLARQQWWDLYISLARGR